MEHHLKHLYTIHDKCKLFNCIDVEEESYWIPNHSSNVVQVIYEQERPQSGWWSLCKGSKFFEVGYNLLSAITAYTYSIHSSYVVEFTIDNFRLLLPISMSLQILS